MRVNISFNILFPCTTYNDTFTVSILQEKLPDFPDQSAAYRKCHSQFTDTSDYRRPGRNTWQDESGLYANTHYKRQVIQSRNPIPEQKV